MKITKSQIKKICKKIERNYIDYSFLGRGNHNENFLVETEQEKLVLRIEIGLQYKNLRKEYKFLKKTAGKFGPKVFLFDNSKSIIPRDFVIEEFIEGKHSMKATDDFITAMAKWLKMLHRVKNENIPKFAKSKNYYSLTKSFGYQGFELYKKNRDVLDTTLLKQLNRIYDEVAVIVKENEKMFSRQKYFSLNHGDLCRGNIFYDQGKVKLIDWEFVKYDLIQWDLVSFIFFFDLNKKKKDLFLSAYKYGKSVANQKKLDIILLLHILWMTSWRIEKIKLVRCGEIGKNQHYSAKKEIKDGILKDLSKAKRLIKCLDIEF